MNTFFIPGNVPSSKNSKQWTGHSLISSPLVQSYKRDTEVLYRSYAPQFRQFTKDMEKPLYIVFTFVRSSHRRFDYLNPAQTVQDMMVSTGWIDDDNANELIPVFLPYEYNKEKPGVYISIMT